jgi:hypothetical protein
VRAAPDSGGINPLLWRPIAGTHSFNIPPIAFNLSPFLPLLNDGATHHIAARLSHGDHEGLWYLDPVLLLWRASSPAPLTGRILTLERTPPDVHVNVATQPAPHAATKFEKAFTVHTSGTSSFTITSEMGEEAPPPPAAAAAARRAGVAAAGVVAGPEQDGRAHDPLVTTHSVSGQLTARNVNAFDTSETGASDTSGTLEYRVESTVSTSRAGLLTDPIASAAAAVIASAAKQTSARGAARAPAALGTDGKSGASASAALARLMGSSAGSSPSASVHVSSYSYPYHVWDHEQSDAASRTFLLRGKVSLGSSRREEVSWSGMSEPLISGVHAASETPSSLVLEWRTALAARAAYNRTNDASRRINLQQAASSANWSSPAACFTQRLAALNGGLTVAHFDEACAATALRDALCRRFDGCAATRYGVNAGAVHDWHAAGLAAAHGGDDAINDAQAVELDGVAHDAPVRTRRRRSASAFL